MRTYLVRIPRRQGHSNQSDVLLASAAAGLGRRIHGPNRVGPNGRDLELPKGSSDRTTGRSVAPFVSSLSCPVRQPLRGGYNTFGLGGG